MTEMDTPPPVRRVVLVPPWNWTSLTEGTPTWRAAWHDLGAWVEWYTDTFGLWSAMPVCWFRHSRLVEELRALRFFHQGVFEPTVEVPLGSAASPASLPSGQDHWLWHIARQRWERVALGVDARGQGLCGALEHEPVSASTAAGHEERRRRMRDGLSSMVNGAAVPPATSHRLGGQADDR